MALFCQSHCMVVSCTRHDNLMRCEGLDSLRDVLVLEVVSMPEATMASTAKREGAICSAKNRVRGSLAAVLPCTDTQNLALDHLIACLDYRTPRSTHSSGTAPPL